MAKKKNKQTPLTLEGLAGYNQKVLLPALGEIVATKDDIKNFVTKQDFSDFKNETLTTLDKMLKKLDILLSEKGVREYQEKKQKKLWAIVIKALRDNQILNRKDLEEIAKLEIF